jgi:hypothetical protein
MPKKNSKTISEELKEESVAVESPAGNGNAYDELVERISRLESIVREQGDKIAKLEKNAPKRLTSADFCGM